MSRQTGSNNFAGTLEILAGGPIDARLVVPTKADLTVSANFPYPYVGMIVSVSGEGKAYILTATPVTDEDNWDEVGSGSADVELTQAEYDALPASKETDGVNYFIKDGIPASKRIVETGFTPVGTIISVMGTTAPQHYLACDGTIVNIADYPVLASYFEEQFGEVNFFGGDGTTTFALPDLRGEFLRGTGTNSHTNQGSGASVGEHQDATEHLYIVKNGNGYVIIDAPTTTEIIPNNRDSDIRKFTGKTFFNNAGGDAYQDNSHYTSRPTNTSVLYCIATKNIYVDPRFDYSLDEKVVGTWIDGKPLYQKTVSDTMPTGITEGTRSTKKIDISSLNVGTLVNIFGSIIRSAGTVPLNSVSNSSNGTTYFTIASLSDNNTAIFVGSSMSADSGMPVYVTIQYTKTTD